MQLLNDILTWFERVPLLVWAIIIGLVVSWVLTQRVKGYFPKKWRHENRQRAAQLTAFVSGSGMVLLLVPTRIGIAVAIAVGLASPAAWNIVVALIAKRWPEVSEAVTIRGKS